MITSSEAKGGQDFPPAAAVGQIKIFANVFNGPVLYGWASQAVDLEGECLALRAYHEIILFFQEPEHLSGQLLFEDRGIWPLFCPDDPRQAEIEWLQAARRARCRPVIHWRGLAIVSAVSRFHSLFPIKSCASQGAGNGPADSVRLDAIQLECRDVIFIVHAVA